MFFDRFDDVWYAVFCQFWNILFFLFSSKVWRLKKYLFWIPFWVNKNSIVLLVIHLRKIWQITVSKFAIFYSQSVTLTNLPSSTPAASQPPVSRQPASQPPASRQPAASHRPASQSLHPPSASQPPATCQPAASQCLGVSARHKSVHPIPKIAEKRQTS